MDIAALSMNMSAASTNSKISTAVLKMTMDSQKELAQTVVDDLISAVPAPQTGHIDISV